MGNAVYPTLPGLAFDSVKTPVWSTRVLTAASGKEQRAANWSYPRWKFSLTYDLLRGDAVHAELQTLMGFFLARQGSFDSFLYQDPTDNAVSGQVLGTGDGVTTQFPFLRSLGGFVEPVGYVSVLGTVSVGGVVQPSGSVYLTGASNNVLAFYTAPAAGAAVVASFSFYYRCRFLQDETAFGQFMQNLWDAKKVEFESVK